MTTTAISIGIPVFNEERRLQACLESVSAQSFTDFSCFISDNASTDSTGEIARAFAARDPRFTYVRQPENMGAMANFRAVLEAASSPYFAWRAADDTWAANYLEVLHGLLVDNPAKTLAVGGTLGTFRGEVISTTAPPKLRGDGSLADAYRLMFGASPGWFYGLYRRAPLTEITRRALDAFGDDSWAADFLILLPIFMDAVVIGSDATTFEQALRPRAGPPGQPKPPRTEPDLDARIALRRRFLESAQGFIDERAPAGPHRVLWAALLFLYVDRRVYKTRHIIRRSARRLIGLKP